MKKKVSEFIDKDRKVAAAYYDLQEKYDGTNAKTIKTEIEKLIKEDPDFLDTYLLLLNILEDEGKFEEAAQILDEAFNRAVNLITDKNGNWPDMLEWGLLENRHIIRTILNKAILLWDFKQFDEALNLLRKLLKTNPGDNIGARDYILAIRMNMSFEDFENRFNKGGFYDTELSDWFEKNYKKFPDEFGWWEKAMEKFM